MRPMLLRRVVAIALLVVSVGATGAAAWAEGAARSTTPATTDPIVIALASIGAGLSWSVVGGVLAWLRPVNALGWLLLSVGTVTQLSIGEASLAAAGVLGAIDPGSPYASRLVGLTLTLLGGLVIYLLIGLLPVLYPSGRIRPARSWTWLTIAVLVGAVAMQVQWLLAQLSADWTWPADPTPAGTSGPEIWIPLGIYAAGVLGVWALCLVRLVRSTSPERQQLAWLLAAVAALVIANIAGANIVAQWAQLVTLYLFPAAIAVGILRYRLLGIEAPARVDPVKALSELGQRVSGTEQHELLDAVLAGIGGAVRASAGRAIDASGSVLAAFGDSPAALSPAFTAVLSVGATPVGRLELGERESGRRYTLRDQRMLQTMASQLAAVVLAVRLADELESERDAVVRARDTERDRLRREIHDGLGPSLTGVTLGVQGLRDAIAAGSVDRALEIADILSAELTGTVTDVRRILDELRPVALVTHGLADAVRERVASITAPVSISVHAADLPVLPGPIEEAAYRVVNEAIANVLRHAGAQNATVTLAIDSGCLVVNVRDDGAGFSTEAAAGGIGLASMRTRAEALDGSLQVDSSPAGTAVTFTVPLPVPVPLPTLAVV